MPQTATQTKPRQHSGWTPERRAAQAAAIRRWSPWTKSTGPRTASGKARAAQNAAKPWKKYDTMVVTNAALKLQRRYLNEIRRLMSLRKNLSQNELLKPAFKNYEKMVRRLGRMATDGLIFALIHHKLCKNLDFSGPPVQIVNANDNR